MVMIMVDGSYSYVRWTVDGGPVGGDDGRRRLEVVRPSFVQTLPASLPRVTTDGLARSLGRDTRQQNTSLEMMMGAVRCMQYATAVPPSFGFSLLYQEFFGFSIKQ
jgi:hypothetical protein